MNTVKRLILIEASLQRCPNYCGKFDEKHIILHSATQIINQISENLK